MAPPVSLTALYRARLAALRTTLRGGLEILWDRFWDGANWARSLERLGLVGGTWAAGGQAQAAAEAGLYLRSLIAQAAGTTLAQVAPAVLPAQLVGRAANGAPLAALLTTSGRAGYWANLGQGLSREGAARAVARWFATVVDSEAYRAANTTVLEAARLDERFTGRVNRITEPGACHFCIEIADRGYLPAHAGFAAHRNCHCTASPEVSTYVTSRAAVRRSVLAHYGTEVSYDWAR